MTKLICVSFLVILLLVIKASCLANTGPYIYRRNVIIDGKKMAYEIRESDVDYNYNINSDLPHKIDYYINIAQNELKSKYKISEGYECSEFTLKYIHIPTELKNKKLIIEFVFRLIFDDKKYTRNEFADQHFLKQITVPVLLNGKIPELKIDNEK